MVSYAKTYAAQNNTRDYIGQSCTSEAQDTVQQTSDLDILKNRLDEIINFANHQGERIDMLAAKLYGGGVTCQTEKAPPQARPIACGTLSQLGERIGDIMDRLQRTDASVSRLRDAI